MQSIERPAIQQARQRLQALSEDEQARHQAFVRERALRDEITEKAAAKAEGLIEGEKKGQRIFLRRLLQTRFGPLPSSLEQRLQQASEDELNIWGERVLSAEQLEQVFVD